MQVSAAWVAILFTVYCSSFNSFSGSKLQLWLQRMAVLDLGLQRVPRFGLDLNENVKFPATHHAVLLGPYWSVMDQNGAINGVRPAPTCKPLSLTVSARY